jgi:hypothetical protein
VELLDRQRGEAVLGEFDGVDPRNDVRETVGPRRGRDERPFHVRLIVCDGDLDLGDHSAGCIRHRATDTTQRLTVAARVPEYERDNKQRDNRKNPPC